MSEYCRPFGRAGNTQALVIGMDEEEGMYLWCCCKRTSDGRGEAWPVSRIEIATCDQLLDEFYLVARGLKMIADFVKRRGDNESRLITQQIVGVLNTAPKPNSEHNNYSDQYQHADTDG